MIPIDTKDIFKSRPLGKGFLIFQNKDGYFVGFQKNGHLEIVQKIDKLAYNTIEKSEGGRKK